MRKVCYIFGAGEGSIPKATPPRDEVFVIAADGGYPLACRAFGGVDLAVGDFDSLGYLPEGVATVRHPAEKDDTDLALAAEEAIARGYHCLFIYGALGGRLDHTVAALQLIAGLADRGVSATLVGADGVFVTPLTGGFTAVFSEQFAGTLSVLAIGGEAEGVVLSGVKYPLGGATLSPIVPLGISNEFLGGEARVSLARGTLLLFYRSENESIPHILES